MATSIGAINFIKMEGPQLPSLSIAVAIIDRKAVDGIAYRDEALKSEEITKHTIEALSSATSAKAAADDYAALKGTRVTVEDDLGRKVYNALVVDVRVTYVQAIAVSSPAGINYLVGATWLLRPTQ